MSKRTLAVVALLLAIGWWFSPLSPRVPAPPATVDGTLADCPMPPGTTTNALPLQSDVPHGMRAIELQPGSLTPLAGFSIEARVLSREDYTIGREAEFSPTDLALGWGKMRDDSVLSRLAISQSGRWYRYRWQGDPPIPPGEITRSSANMHMIPSNAQVAAELRKVRSGDNVRVDGWLVRADTPDGWRWVSSLTREDSGAGACELVYVCSITRL